MTNMASAASGLKASDLKAFEHAAAGHDGVLSDESGTVVVKPCTAQEVAFYESASSHPNFAKWIPTYMGTLSLSPEIPSSDPATAALLEGAAKKSHNRDTSIVLSNLAHGFKYACVLDIKLGAQLWDSAAPQDKRDRLDEVARKTTSCSLGFRITGMRVWKKKEGEEVGEYKVYQKHYGRTFTAENVVEGIREYFASDISEAQVKLLAGRFLEKVRKIREVLENQESRMYSASLLFSYEGDGKALEEALKEEKEREGKKKETADDDDDDEEEEDEKVRSVEDLKMIDFAHATWTPGLGPDENVLKGVRSVEKILEELV